MTPLGWGDAADYFHERDMWYKMTKSMVPAVVKLQTDTTAAIPMLTTFGELMLTLVIIPGQLEMLQGTSGTTSSQMRLTSEKP